MCAVVGWVCCVCCGVVVVFKIFVGGPPDPVPPGRPKFRFTRQPKNTPNVDISGPRRFKHPQISVKGPPRERRKKENVAGEEKKERSFGPARHLSGAPPFGAPPSSSHHDTPDPKMDGPKLDWPKFGQKKGCVLNPSPSLPKKKVSLRGRG